MMSLRTEKTIGYFEIILSVLIGIVCIISFKTAYFPSLDSHWESPGWAFLVFILFTPLSISIAISGVALLKNFKRKWETQLLPIIILSGIAIFFWWVDIGSL